MPANLGHLSASRLLLLLVLQLACPMEAQVIRLRRPGERLPHLPNWLTGHNRQDAQKSPNEQQVQPVVQSAGPQGGGLAHPARAGNVIVHFDKDHEIQRLEYMLKDGRLATIYTHHQDQHQHQQLQQQQQQQQQLLPLNAEEVLGKQQQLVGQQQFPIKPAYSIATIDFEDNEHEHELEAGEPNEHAEKDEILSHMAQDAVKASLPKTRNFLRRIKQKLSRLPHLLQKKLQAKSSHGQTYLDRGPPDSTGQQQATTATMSTSFKGNGQLPEGQLVQAGDSNVFRLPSNVNTASNFGLSTAAAAAATAAVPPTTTQQPDAAIAQKPSSS